MSSQAEHAPAKADDGHGHETPKDNKDDPQHHQPEHGSHGKPGEKWAEAHHRFHTVPDKYGFMGPDHVEVYQPKDDERLICMTPWCYPGAPELPTLYDRFYPPSELAAKYDPEAWPPKLLAPGVVGPYGLVVPKLYKEWGPFGIPQIHGTAPPSFPVLTLRQRWNIFVNAPQRLVDKYVKPWKKHRPRRRPILQMFLVMCAATLVASFTQNQDVMVYDRKELMLGMKKQRKERMAHEREHRKAIAVGDASVNVSSSSSGHH